MRMVAQIVSCVQRLCVDILTGIIKPKMVKLNFESRFRPNVKVYDLYISIKYI